jgi:hypothetical protein
VWQGSAVPSGVMVRNMLPQPFMHFFGRCLVVVGHHEEHAHLVAELLAPFVGDPLGAFELFARRQQLVAVDLRPAVVLRVGQFDVLGAELVRPSR